MSTFSGLNTAYTGLQAARASMDVIGQNITNAKTAGYTRQRIDQAAMAPLGTVGLISQKQGVGQGVVVTGVARLGDTFLDARVRSSQSVAGYAGTRASALDSLEKTLNEPSKNGIGAQLQSFWSSWQDLSNHPGEPASGAVVIKEAGVLADQIARSYTQVASQWDAMRAEVGTLTTQLNSAAQQIAGLNGAIFSSLAAGGNANELIDQRSQLAADIAALAGGTVAERPDGTIDVLIGGNPIVTGSDVNAVTVTGAMNLGGGVQLEWQRRPGLAIALDGGEIAGSLSILAPADATGTGGALAEAAVSFNALATAIHDQVNGVHRTGATTTGTTNLDFFQLQAGVPAALGLRVVPASVADIAAANPGSGALDGSIADAIGQLAKGPASPDALWQTFVSTVAVSAKSELKQSALADLTATAALTQQLSHASVDLDEENVNLLMSQTAYQGAARVLTAVDEMLDTLINKTGLVGR